MYEFLLVEAEIKVIITGICKTMTGQSYSDRGNQTSSKWGAKQGTVNLVWHSGSEQGMTFRVSRECLWSQTTQNPVQLRSLMFK